MHGPIKSLCGPSVVRGTVVKKPGSNAHYPFHIPAVVTSPCPGDLPSCCVYLQPPAKMLAPNSRFSGHLLARAGVADCG